MQRKSNNELRATADGSDLRSPSAAAAKIRARGVTVAFESRDRIVQALGPVDLSVNRGEFVCLVGPSGCGKSTFVRVVAGLLAPDSGAMEIDIDGSGFAPMATVFQDFGIFPWKTVAANVAFGLTVRGMSKSQARVRALDWLSRLGLLEFADAYPNSLSGGMRQRVAIARALVVEPEILLMDEPFAALDAQLREILQDELLAIHQAHGRTVIFVTHSLEEAIVLGDRVVVMSARPGRILDSKRVPFERPRTRDIRESAEFGQLRAELWEHLRVEVEMMMSSQRAAGEA